MLFGDRMTKPGRIPCVVPYCRRTADATKFEGCDEIICGKHWRMAPASWRRRHSRMFRTYRRRFGNSGYWEFPAGSPQRIDAVRLHRLCETLWQRCKRAAIEAAAGIA
jgi:hypothetical protein